MRAISDDLPTLGKPSSPTSASSLSSRRTVALLARRSRFGLARRPVGRRREVDVAAPALAALGDDEALAVGAQIADQRAGRLVEHLRPGRHAQHDVLAAAPVLVLVGARGCPGGAGNSLLVAEVEQRRQPLVDDQHDAAAVAAVAARGAALGDELLAPEGDRAVAAVAGLHADRRLRRRSAWPAGSASACGARAPLRGAARAAMLTIVRGPDRL